MDEPMTLDALMTALQVTGEELVSISREQLTHKQVTKARHGRYITPNIQGKIVRALKKYLAARKIDRTLNLVFPPKPPEQDG